MKNIEKQYLASVRDLGCIVCRNQGNFEVAADIHHISKSTSVRDSFNTNKKADKFKVIPLCFIHHEEGAAGIALHANRELFESEFGTEQELLEQVNELLDAS